MERWYTIYTKPNVEHQVVSALQKRGFQTYLPEIRITKARKQYERKPFFPCYLFVRIDLDVVGSSQLQWTPGLRRIVTFFDEKPIPVPEKVIEFLQKKLGAMETGDGSSSSVFKPGDPVLITDGPFRDMAAIFDGPTTPSERVQVLLKILGHTNRVQVDATDLEKVTRDDQVSLPKRPRRTRGQGRRIKS